MILGSQGQKRAGLPVLLRAGLLAAMVGALFLAGCLAGSGEGLDENGLPLVEISPDAGDSDAPAAPPDGSGDSDAPADPSDGSGDSGNPNATFSWIQNNVWSAICTKCHSGLEPSRELSWEEDKSCNNVGRQSGENPDLLIIAPEDPDGSYMIWKLEGQGPNGESIVGGQMPLEGDPLAPETIQNIREWISAGASCS